MRYSVAIFAIAATVAAAPLSEPNLCPDGLFSNPQCCATDVLGVVDLDCDVPPVAPADVNSFTATCSDIGQRARCCVLPVAGQAILCQDVSPSDGNNDGAPTPSSTGKPEDGAPDGGPSPTSWGSDGETKPSPTGCGC